MNDFEETRFIRNESPDQYVKHFEKYKHKAIKFNLTKSAREKPCLKESYWRNPIEWQNHLLKEKITSRNKNQKSASLIDAVESLYLRLSKDVCKAVY